MFKRIKLKLGAKGRLAIVGAGGALAATNAMAAKLELVVLGEFGCSLLDFFTGSLAVWAFVLVAVITLVIGLVAKIDFSKLIQVVVIFGVLQGFGGWVAPMISNADSCIANNGQ